MGVDFKQFEDIVDVLDDAYMAFPKGFHETADEVSHYQIGIYNGLRIAIESRRDQLNITELTLDDSIGLGLDDELWKNPSFLLGAFAGSLALNKIVARSEAE